MRTTSIPTARYEPMTYLADALLCIHEEAEDDSDILEYVPRTTNEDEAEWEYGNY